MPKKYDDDAILYVQTTLYHRVEDIDEEIAELITERDAAKAAMAAMTDITSD